MSLPTDCSHCKEFGPVFEKAAEILEDEKIPLAQVNCAADSAICKRYKIQSYPVVVHFRNGVMTQYNRDRTIDDLVSIARKFSGPDITVLETEQAFDEFIAYQPDASIVGFFSSKEDAAVYLDLAKPRHDDFHFGVVYSPELIKAKNGGKTGVATFRNYPDEDKVVPYTGDLADQDGLLAFFSRSSVPTVGKYNKWMSVRYSAVDIPRIAYTVSFNADFKSAEIQKTIALFHKVASEFKGKVYFTITNPYDPEAYHLKLRKGMFVVFINAEAFFHHLTEVTEENVRTIVKDALSGNVQKFLRSEAVPTTESIVQHVVGKNFVQEVMNSDKNVFIKFYAPWCGHCKNLAPKYEALARRLEHDPKFKVVEVDATSNDFPDVFHVTGYPTLYLLKADDKEHPVQYRGDRSPGDMEKWLKDQISTKKEL